MLSKSKRLNLKKDFTWVVSGRKIEDNFVKIFFRLGENIDPRVGITSPKTVFKKANDRNRARRLISKGFENLYGNLSKGLNIIALPKAEVLGSNADIITDDLRILLERNGLLKDYEKNND